MYRYGCLMSRRVVFGSVDKPFNGQGDWCLAQVKRSLDGCAPVKSGRRWFRHGWVITHTCLNNYEKGECSDDVVSFTQP